MHRILVGVACAFTLFSSVRLETANAQSITDIPFRLFAGTKHLTSSEGDASVCKEDKLQLKLRVDHGTISNMTGSCKGPIQPDGTFSGQCNLSSETLYFSGKANPNIILLHTKQVYSGGTCQYDTELHWSP